MSTNIQFGIFAVAILFCFTEATLDEPGIRLSYTLGKRKNVSLCMTPCAKHGESFSWCYTSWTEWDHCELQSEDDPMQIFVPAEKSNKTGQDCTSLCGKFDWESEWCFVGTTAKPLDWALCSTKQVMLSFTETDSKMCMTDCLPTSPKDKEIIGKQEYSCKSGWTTTEKCNPQSIFLKAAATTANTFCSAHCGNFGTSYPWCEADGGWKNCSDSAIQRLNEVFDPKAVNSNNVTEHARHQLLRDFFNPLLGNKDFTHNSPQDDVHSVVNNFVEDYIITLEKLGTLKGFGYRDGEEVLSFHYSMVNGVMLVHSMQAKLFPDFLDNNRTSVNTDTEAIKRHMTGHGARNDDVKGHILSPRFGGPNLPFNIVPQSFTHKYALPGSRWANIENEIAEVLEDMKGTIGFVQWNMAIAYDPVTYRPLKYVHQHTNIQCDYCVGDRDTDEIMQDP